MKVVDAVQMREIDRRTIEDFGLASAVLMERAGLSVVKRITDLFDPSRKVVVLAGGGNNGGDGLVAARLLHNAGWDVRAFVVSPRDGLSRDCLGQFETALKMGVRIEAEKIPSPRELSGAVVVDALVGTGLNKPLRDGLSLLVKRVNRARTDVVAVDIPTGISADTGRIMGTAVKADVTVTFGLPKRGHLFHPGAGYSGRLFVEDIGFPPALLNAADLRLELVEQARVPGLLPPRNRNSHKGDYGHVFVAGGSPGKTGAPLLCAKAALRCGAGLVTIGVPDTIITSLSASVLEEMTMPLPSTPRGGLSGEGTGAVLEFLRSKADVLAIGPGLSTEVETVGFVLETVAGSPVPLVIDADGLNALSSLGRRGAASFLRELRSPAVLTPHPGEMARLLGTDVADVSGDPVAAARGLASEAGVHVVLKSVPVVTAAPDGRCFINTTGNPGMATAGTGDVLTGVVASLMAQGLTPLHAAVAGVFLHGLSGDLAAAVRTEHALTAGDLVEGLPGALGCLLGVSS